jgi:hypothetical protein
MSDLDVARWLCGAEVAIGIDLISLCVLIGGYFGDKFGPRLTLCVCSLIVCVATAAVVDGRKPNGSDAHMPSALRH